MALHHPVRRCYTLKGKYPVHGTCRSKETRQKLECCSSLPLPGQGSLVLHRELLTLTESDLEGYTRNRVQPRGRPQIGICNGVQNSRCPGNIRKIYIGCPHPHKPELGEGTHGAGPFRAVLYSNSCAANLWHGHLTYL